MMRNKSFQIVKGISRICFVLVTCALIPGVMFPFLAKLYLANAHINALLIHALLILIIYVYMNICLIVDAYINYFPKVERRKEKALFISFWILGLIFGLYSEVWHIATASIFMPNLVLVCIVPCNPLTPWDLVGAGISFNGAVLWALSLMFFLKDPVACSAHSFRRIHRFGMFSLIVVSCCFSFIGFVFYRNGNTPLAIGTVGAYGIVASQYYVIFYLSRRVAKTFLEMREGVFERVRDHHVKSTMK